MRTTIDLPENLIKEAMQITKIKTKKKVIIKALEEMINRYKLSELKNYKGKINLDIDLDILRDRKWVF